MSTNPFASAGGSFQAGSSGSNMAAPTALKTMRTNTAAKMFASKPKGVCKKRKRKKGEIVPPALEDCYYEEEE